MGNVRDAIELRLDGNRDLLFDFFRGVSRPLRDDIHIRVGDVGIRLHRQDMKRVGAPGQEQNGDAQNQPSVPKSKVNQTLNHTRYFRASLRRIVIHGPIVQLTETLSLISYDAEFFFKDTQPR